MDCYLKVNRTNTNNATTMATAWTKAAELAIKFLDSDKGPSINYVGKRGGGGVSQMPILLHKPM